MSENNSDEMTGLINENRRLYYQINRERILELRRSSIYACPCGREVITSNKPQHFLSKHHRLYILENPTVVIPSKTNG